MTIMRNCTIARRQDVSPDLCCSEQGWTGLHHAAAAGRAKCYHCLLQHGANRTLRNLSGDTSMEVARLNGKPVAISKAGTIKFGHS